MLSIFRPSFYFAYSIPALPVGIWPFYLVALLFAVPSRMGYLEERLFMVV
jgi:hypothetical protein